MALFSYIVKTREGKTVKNAEDFSSREELISRLKAQGYFIISIKELKDSGSGQGSAFFSSKKKGHRKIELIDLAFFARNLSTTLSSGVPLLRSLEVMAQQSESIKLCAITRNIINDIKRGLSLSEALAKYPQVFSNLWLGITEVGEATGNLPFVLEKLALYLEMRLDFERKVKSAMVYPVILMIAGFFAMLVFFKLILPKFTELFEQFEITLPLPTQILFNISEVVNHYFLFIVAGLVGLYFLFNYARKQKAVLDVWDRISLKIPLFGDTVVLTCVERFSSTMFILLESGVPIVYTLEVVAKSLGNSFIAKKINVLKESVKKGRNLSGEISKLYFFPSLVTELVSIGEEAGNLSEMFKKLSVHYQKELSTKIERLVAAFEPIMIVMMSVVIGGIVISLFLPLFKLSTMGG